MSFALALLKIVGGPPAANSFHHPSYQRFLREYNDWIGKILDVVSHEYWRSKKSVKAGTAAGWRKWWTDLNMPASVCRFWPLDAFQHIPGLTFFSHLEQSLRDKYPGLLELYRDFPTARGQDREDVCALLPQEDLANYSQGLDALLPELTELSKGTNLTNRQQRFFDDRGLALLQAFQKVLTDCVGSELDHECRRAIATCILESNSASLPARLSNLTGTLGHRWLSWQSQAE
ncbi:hypothetical protein ACM66B_006022 [Microbotryomycetes sp. NB124-2]